MFNLITQLHETKHVWLTTLVLVMVSAIMLAAPGSSVTGIKGRDEAEAAEGVTAEEGVVASSDAVT